MKAFVLFFQIVLLAGVFIVAIYNWLYFIQTNKVGEKLGITLPQGVKSMLFFNLIIPILALCVLIFFLLGNLFTPS